MAGKDATIASMLISIENMKRDLHLKDNEIQRLKKLMDDKDKKLDDAIVHRTSSSREHEKLTRDNDRLIKEVTSLRHEKQTLYNTVQENSVYIKKLESRLIGGGKEHLLEQNMKLKQQVQTLKESNDALANTVERQKQELQRSVREIEVLATALEMRAEEFKIKGDTKSGLLYEVATLREENKRLAQELTFKSERLSALEFEGRETAVKLDKYETDNLSLLGRTNALQQALEVEQHRVEDYMKRLQEAEHQRDVSLDYVSEQAAKISNCELQTQQAESRVQQLQHDLATAENAKNAAEQRAAQFSQVQQATLTALQQEKAQHKETMERLQTSQKQCLDLQSKVEQVRAELVQASSRTAELETLLLRKTEENSALAEKVARMTADFRTLSDTVALERASLSNESDTIRSAARAYADKFSKIANERDDAVMRARDANARVASLIAENGRLTEVNSRLQAQLVAAKAKISGIGATDAEPVVSHSSGKPARSVAAVSTAEELVRKTLKAAGLDEGEAARWFAKGAGVEESVGVKPPASPGTAALQAALDRSRHRRAARQDVAPPEQGKENTVHMAEWLKHTQHLHGREVEASGQPQPAHSRATQEDARQVDPHRPSRADLLHHAPQRRSDRVVSTAVAMHNWIGNLRSPSKTPDSSNNKPPTHSKPRARSTSSQVHFASPERPDLQAHRTNSPAARISPSAHSRHTLDSSPSHTTTADDTLTNTRGVPTSVNVSEPVAATKTVRSIVSVPAPAPADIAHASVPAKTSDRVAKMDNTQAESQFVASTLSSAAPTQTPQVPTSLPARVEAPVVTSPQVHSTSRDSIPTMKKHTVEDTSARSQQTKVDNANDNAPGTPKDTRHGATNISAANVPPQTPEITRVEQKLTLFDVAAMTPSTPAASQRPQTPPKIMQPPSAASESNVTASVPLDPVQQSAHHVNKDENIKHIAAISPPILPPPAHNTTTTIAASTHAPATPTDQRVTNTTVPTTAATSTFKAADKQPQAIASAESKGGIAPPATPPPTTTITTTTDSSHHNNSTVPHSTVSIAQPATSPAEQTAQPAAVPTTAAAMGPANTQAAAARADNTNDTSASAKNTSASAKDTSANANAAVTFTAAKSSVGDKKASDSTTGAVIEGGDVNKNAGSTIVAADKTNVVVGRDSVVADKTNVVGNNHAEMDTTSNPVKRSPATTAAPPPLPPTAAPAPLPHDAVIPAEAQRKSQVAAVSAVVVGSATAVTSPQQPQIQPPPIAKPPVDPSRVSGISSDVLRSATPSTPSITSAKQSPSASAASSLTSRISTFLGSLTGAPASTHTPKKDTSAETRKQQAPPKPSPEPPSGPLNSYDEF